MKRILSRIFLLVILIAITAGCQSGKVGADSKTIAEITAAYPDRVSILFDNNYVVVVEYRLNPGDKLPLHELGDRTIYALTPGAVKFNADQAGEAATLSEGDTFWQKAGPLAPENVGENETRLLVVARTEALLPEFAVEDLEQDVSQTAPEIATQLMDNDYVRVIEVNLEPGEEINTHRGIARVVYSLEPYTIDYVAEDTAGSGQKTFEAGHTHWHQAGSHSLVNIGETAMHDLIFEFKK